MRVGRKFWDAACAVEGYAIYDNCFAWGVTAELQVFGEGYPREVRLRSPLLDLGGSKNIRALRWQAETLSGTGVEVRSRTGDQLERQVAYYDKNGKEVTRKKWGKLIPSFRGPVDTTLVPGKDWAPWSQVYAFPGAPFQSPSPRRYLELEARLVSQDPQAAASLDWLSVDYAVPLADRVVGEIWPAQVQAGVWTPFTYFLRAQGATRGFDQVEVRASSVPLHFERVRLGGKEVDSSAGGFGVHLPRPVGEGETIGVDFSGAVYVDATKVEVFVADSRQPGRQQVEAGQVEGGMGSQADVVRLATGETLLANVHLGTAVLTPNGDGVNDQLVVEFSLVNVLEARPLLLQCFDLSGQLAAQVEVAGVAGAQRWCGTGGMGRDNGCHQGFMCCAWR